VELLITIAVIGILASLAIPAYYRMIAAAHRAEAQGLLADLYGMEAAFFAEMQRYGCLNEVGFQIEGKGHFAIWICDDGSGCYLEPNGGITCPCLEAPDDWTGPGGDPFVRRDAGDPGVRYAWMPIPRGGGGSGFFASGPPVLTTVPVFPVVPILPVAGAPLLPSAWGPVPGAQPESVTPSDPSSLPVPIDLPSDCAAVMANAVFTAGADNWCARAVPEVVDVFWILSNEGKQVNSESYPELGLDPSVCLGEGSPPAP
jgi:hypothetical protein